MSGGLWVPDWGGEGGGMGSGCGEWCWKPKYRLGRLCLCNIKEKPIMQRRRLGLIRKGPPRRKLTCLYSKVTCLWRERTIPKMFSSQLNKAMSSWLASSDPSPLGSWDLAFCSESTAPSGQITRSRTADPPTLLWLLTVDFLWWFSEAYLSRWIIHGNSTKKQCDVSCIYIYFFFFSVQTSHSANHVHWKFFLKRKESQNRAWAFFCSKECVWGWSLCVSS